MLEGAGGDDAGERGSGRSGHLVNGSNTKDALRQKRSCLQRLLPNFLIINR